jgi:hypothetical protein
MKSTFVENYVFLVEIKFTTLYKVYNLLEIVEREKEICIMIMLC